MLLFAQSILVLFLSRMGEDGGSAEQLETNPRKEERTQQAKVYYLLCQEEAGQDRCFLFIMCPAFNDAL